MMTAPDQKFSRRAGRAALHIAIVSACALAAGWPDRGSAQQSTEAGAQPAPAADPEAAARLDARAQLTAALARIAADPADFQALEQAGRSALVLGDARAALGFLARAEALAPRDPRIKAALGATMVQLEDPAQALRYFDAAIAAGGLERVYLGDRGLAYDLLGDQRRAQADYAVAEVDAPSAELTRRHAISLGISGHGDDAVRLLGPLLRAQDRAAWRSRALIVAMNGDPEQARQIARATMPAQLAEALDPYFALMDRLTPAQLAAAATFGRFPTYDVVRAQPSRRQAAQQLAAATPPVPTTPPSAGASGRAGDGRSSRIRTRDRTRPRVATATPTPAPAAVQPALASARDPGLPPVASAPPPPAAASAMAAPTRTGDAVQTAAAAGAGTRTVAQAGAPSMPPSVSVAVVQPLPQPVPQPVPTPPATPAATPVPTPPAPATQRVADIGPAFSTLPRVTGDSGPQPAAPSANTTVIAGWSLESMVQSIVVPDAERTASQNALSLADLEAIANDRRRAREEEQRRAQADARTRAAADAAARARAEAEAEARAQAELRRRNPARTWVQIATGANPSALAFDCRRFRRDHAAAFEGKSCASAVWNRTRRLVVGPFRDGAAARDWLARYTRDGGSGFVWSSDAGEEVTPIGRQ